MRPQLRRSPTDKIVGGVSGGLAEYSGIDALLWRVGFVALALAGGSGVVVYLLLWLLMPAGWTAPSATGAAGVPSARRPVEPRSPVPVLTVAGLLIVVGLLALIDRLPSVDLDATGFLGAALLVVAAGLVAAAFAPGRTARGGLIALGVLLSLALVVAAADVRGPSGVVGDRTYRPATAAEVQEFYRGGAGTLTLDLSRLDVSDLGTVVRTEIRHDIGDVRVLLPAEADTRLEVDIDFGSVDLLGQGSLDGGFFPGRGTGSWVDDGEPELHLVIENGMGDVEVSRG